LVSVRHSSYVESLTVRIRVILQRNRDVDAALHSCAKSTRL
jgi:hypothetical protein